MTGRSERGSDVLLVRTLGYDWAVACGGIEEILPHRQAVRAPGSAPFVEGVVRYRSGLLPVVDLALRFRLPPGARRPDPPPPESRQTLVVRLSGGMAGLAVDEVIGRRALGEDEVLAVLDPVRILETEAPLDLPLHARTSGFRATPAMQATPATPAMHAPPSAPRRPASRARRSPRRGRRIAAAAALLVSIGVALLLATRDREPRAVVAGVTGVTAPPEAPPDARSPSPPRESPAAPDRSSRLVLTLEEQSASGGAAGGEPDQEVIEYTVVSGDTLWTIARRYTSSPFRYREIASDNDVDDPHLIFPGQALTLRIERFR